MAEAAAGFAGCGQAMRGDFGTGVRQQDCGFAGAHPQGYRGAVTAGEALEFTGGSFRFNSHDLVAGLKQIGHFSFHPQLELRKFFGLGRQEIQKIPLRHKAEEFAMRW